jgi:hypothetical protein
MKGVNDTKSHIPSQNVRSLIWARGCRTILAMGSMVRYGLSDYNAILGSDMTLKEGLGSFSAGQNEWGGKTYGNHKE